MFLLKSVKITAITILGMSICACSSDSSEKIVIAKAKEATSYQPIHITSKAAVFDKNNTVSEDKANLLSDDEGLVIVAAAAQPIEKENLSEEGLVIIASAAKPTQEEIVPVMSKVIEPSSIKIKEVVAAPVSKPVIKSPSINYQIAMINFNDGSSIVDSKYNQKIKQIAKLVKEKNAKLEVLGFSSSRTKDTDIVTHKMINFNLSLKRAQSVVNALTKAGVAANSITMEALSDTMPLYQEVMPTGERLNRRVEVYISY